MPRIDSQMLQIYQNCSNQGNKICETEASQLIARAEELNSSSSSSFSSSSPRGNKYLTILLRDNEDCFSKQGRRLIENYIDKGQLPPDQGAVGGSSGDSAPSGRAGHRPSGVVAGGAGSGAHASGSRPTAGHTTPSHLGGSTPSNVGNGAAGGTGNASAGGVTSPTPSAPILGSTGVVGPNGTVLLDWTASKPTWNCHWFPQQETKEGGDPINNLYAEGGPLHKLDMVTGGNAREHELNNNRKPFNSGREFSWWGHCNHAAEAACVLKPPMHSVVMTGKDGREVKFSKLDIQGLLVKCTPGLITKVDFKGQRFNSPAHDDPNEPYPDFFMDVMMEWSKDGLPFVLDIDRREQVWNFPYDKVKISELPQAPEGFNASALPTDGSVKYYHIDMSGTGYDDKRRVYECYIQRDGSGKVVDRAWINTPNTNNNPDFMWRPHANGDIMNKENWKLGQNPSNPSVDPQIIYEIYMKSLS